MGNGGDHGQTQHLGPAIIYRMEHIQCYTLDLATLYRESTRSPEEVTIQVSVLFFCLIIMFSLHIFL